MTETTIDSKFLDQDNKPRKKKTLYAAKSYIDKNLKETYISTIKKYFDSGLSYDEKQLFYRSLAFLQVESKEEEYILISNLAQAIVHQFPRSWYSPKRPDPKNRKFPPLDKLITAFEILEEQFKNTLDNLDIKANNYDEIIETLNKYNKEIR